MCLGISIQLIRSTLVDVSLRESKSASVTTPDAATRFRGMHVHRHKNGTSHSTNYSPPPIACWESVDNGMAFIGSLAHCSYSASPCPSKIRPQTMSTCILLHLRMYGILGAKQCHDCEILPSTGMRSVEKFVPNLWTKYLLPNAPPPTLASVQCWLKWGLVLGTTHTGSHATAISGVKRNSIQITISFARITSPTLGMWFEYKEAFCFSFEGFWGCPASRFLYFFASVGHPSTLPHSQHAVVRIDIHHSNQ